MASRDRNIWDYFARSDVTLSCVECSERHTLTAPRPGEDQDVMVRCNACDAPFGYKRKLLDRAFEEVAREYDKRHTRQSPSTHWLHKT